MVKSGDAWEWSNLSSSKSVVCDGEVHVAVVLFHDKLGLTWLKELKHDAVLSGLANSAECAFIRSSRGNF